MVSEVAAGPKAGGLEDLSAHGQLIEPGPALDRPKLKAFVGIFTAVNALQRRFSKYAQRREAIRETWLPALQALDGFEVRFVVGRAVTNLTRINLVAELAEFDDMLVLPIADCYHCLPNKTLSYFTTIMRHYDAEWVIKMDDDVYLVPPRLPLAMQQWEGMAAGYVGCMKHGQVHNNPRSKWYEPASMIVGTSYHMNAYGSIYAIAGWVASDVIVRNQGLLRTLSNEDTTMGLWMAAFQVNFFEDMRLCNPSCHPAAVGVLNNMCSGLCNPVPDMHAMHADVICHEAAIAPLPYLPSYPDHKAFENMRV